MHHIYQQHLLTRHTRARTSAMLIITTGPFGAMIRARLPRIRPACLALRLDEGPGHKSEQRVSPLFCLGLPDQIHELLIY